ncbi:MAG: aminoacyl-tRNA hydrolase, partial [Marinilabiliales bacterium]
MLDSRFDKIEKELQFRTSRSSGKGGQSVNKLSTKVELIFFVGESSVLTEEEKALINQRLENRIINDGSILISCDEERSQY